MKFFLIDFLNYDYNKKYHYKFYKNFEKKNILSFFICLFVILLPSKVELSNLIKCFSLKFYCNYFKSLNFVFNKKKSKLYDNAAFFYHKWQHKNEYFKFENFFKKNEKKKQVFFGLQYISLKNLFLILTFFVIIEYLKRILNCYSILIKLYLIIGIILIKFKNGS